MGKLAITGRAERKVKCDAVEMTVEFEVHARKTEAAMEKVLKQTEEFLQMITTAGINMDTVRMGQDSVRQRYDDGVIDVCVSRSIKFCFGFDMKFVNEIMDMVRMKNWSADIECNYFIADKEKIHYELMQEAVLNSKKQAEFIAEVMGQKIVRVEEVNPSKFSSVCRKLDPDEPIKIPEFLTRRSKRYEFSDQLSAPERSEYESVDIVWFIE